MSKWCARQKFLLLLWRHFNLPTFNIVTFFGVSSEERVLFVPFFTRHRSHPPLSSISISDQKLNYEYCKRWTNAMAVSAAKSKVVNCVCRENYPNPIVMIAIYLTAPLWSCKNDEAKWSKRPLNCLANSKCVRGRSAGSCRRCHHHSPGRWLITFSRSNAIVLLITLLRRLSELSLVATT